MPNIQDSLVKLSELSNFTTGPNAGSVGSPIGVDAYTGNLEPVLSPQMRCPLPGVVVAPPDSLRQFYRGGQLPQTRVMLGSQNNPVTSQSGGSGSVVIGSSSSGSTGSNLQILQTAVTTTVIAPNQTFTGTVSLGKAFQLIGISSSDQVRVRLYATQNALQLDSFRLIDVAPAFGTEQGIIMDVALDTAPYVWNLDGLMGNNFDNPQTVLEYIAVTNIGQSASPYIVTLTFIPLVT